jgi:hypothetical protein
LEDGDYDYAFLEVRDVVMESALSCATWGSGTRPLEVPPICCHTTFVPEKFKCA